MSGKKDKSGRRVTPAALVLFVALVLFLWLAPGYLYPILASDIFSEEVQKRRESMYTGVITVWQVDTFEGGTGSRTAWLNRLLASLEKQYNGVYFVVRSMTPERAKTLLASGNESIMPDMLSFGRGLIENPEELLMPISEEYTTGLMPELIDACGGYALPWAFGGYAVFADSELAAKHGLGENISDLPQFLNKLGGPAKYGKTTRDIYALGISNTVKSVPGASLARLLEPGSLNGQYALRSNQEDTTENIWDSYNYSKSICAMLGTQRDIYRMAAAAGNNKLRSSVMLPVSGYTDLVACIGILKTQDEKKLDVMHNVLRLLCRTDTQNTLNLIGLFPAAVSALDIIYQEELLNRLFEELKKQRLLVPSVFASQEQIAEENKLMLEYLRTGAQKEQVQQFFSNISK
ncbi:MAG: hypothetical protein HPZ00_02080 [Christensenellaceae bacterium]|jgi:hypothetical protein|nr:hypothetical protein [Christensenellaceae bacterium]PWL97963.1 MAG: hypothetical protein DBY09_05785 [Selenomonadales bacterium]